jgi:lambda family phage portal protein
MRIRPSEGSRLLSLQSEGLPAVRASASNRQAYEGAGQGRRALSWYAPGSGPSTTVTSNLTTLRNRTRAGYRNTPWIAQAIDRLVSNEVGCGIAPRSRCKDEAFRAAANALFDLWTAESDPAGELNFYGQQAQLSRTRNMAGEVLVRLRRRRLGDGMTVPLQLQVIEPEHLPETKTEALSNGNIIVAGKEYSNRGALVAYHLYTEHPAEVLRGTWSGLPLRVPASEVLHHFLPIRPGQVRAEPVSVQSLLKAKTFDSYDDAELVRKQTRAPYTGFLERAAMTEDDFLFDPMTGEPLKRDGDNVPTLDAQPGTIFAGMAGETLNLFDGDKSGDGYAEFMKQQLLAICAGHGVPYEIVTGDWSGVNDRLVRAILQEFRRSIEMVQDHLLIHQICRPVWENWVDAAVWSGALKAPGYATRRAEYLACEWRPHAWPYVHPTQDIDAKIRAIDAGITSRDAVIVETGWDPEEIDRQNVEGEKRRRAMRKAAGLPEEVPSSNRAKAAIPPPDGGQVTP